MKWERIIYTWVEKNDIKNKSYYYFFFYIFDMFFPFDLVFICVFSMSKHKRTSLYPILSLFLLFHFCLYIFSYHTLTIHTQPYKI